MNLFEVVEQLFDKFGYFVLLFGLPLDFIALPIPPGNSTLTYTGYLSYKGVLNWIPALVMAFAGAILGVTITYSLGYKLGMPLVERYGKFLSLNSSSLDKTRNYYDKFGNKLLLIQQGRINVLAYRQCVFCPFFCCVSHYSQEPKFNCLQNS